MTDTSGQVDANTRACVSGDALFSQLDIGAAEINRRKSFVRLSDVDERRLSDLEPPSDEFADEFAAEPYDHLGEHTTTKFFDRSTKITETLRADQATYLRELGRGEYDKDCFAKRARIGKLHDVIDLGPRFYLGAYLVYYEGILGTTADGVEAEFTGGDTAGSDTDTEFEGDATSDTDADSGLLSGPLGGASGVSSGLHGSDDRVEAAIDEVVECFLLVLKPLPLDQQVAMETYIHSYSQATRKAAECRCALTHEVEADVNDPVEPFLRSFEEVTERTGDIETMARAQTDDMVTVAAEVSELSATVEEIAATAEEVKWTGADVAAHASKGEDATDEAIDVMRDVSEVAETASEDVQRLHDQVAEIDEVLDAINDIAEQTNLLAFNASIEAARAGDAGEDFAIAASEVKNLAEESQTRAAEVEGTVGDIQSETQEIIDSLSQTTERLYDGIDRGKDVMRSLSDISAAVEQATVGVGEAASATDDQAESAGQIAGMVDDTTECATTVLDQIGEIADASRSQTEQMFSIRDAAERLGGETGDGTGQNTLLETGADNAAVGGVDNPPEGVLDDSDFDEPPPNRLSNDGGTSEQRVTVLSSVRVAFLRPARVPCAYDSRRTGDPTHPW